MSSINQVNSPEEPKKGTKSYSKGMFLMSLSGLSVALFALFAKLGEEIRSVPLLIFFRFLIPLLIVFPYALFKGAIEKEEFKILSISNIPRALCVVLSQYFFFFYLTKGTLLDGVVLFNSGMIFIPIFSRIFYKQKVGRRTWIGMFISFIGVLCILKPDTGIVNEYTWIGLASGILMAASHVMFGFHIYQQGMAKSIFYHFLLPTAISLLAFLTWILVKKDALAKIYIGWELHGTSAVIYIIALGSFSVFTQYFRAHSYLFAKPHSLAPVLYLSVVFAAILDWIVFHTFPDFLTVLGAILTVTGGLLKIILKKPPQKIPPKQPLE